MDKQHEITQKEGNHATCSQAEYKIYHSGPHTNYDNQMKSDTNIMLEDDQDNIQASESICWIKWFITMNLYMQGDQNNHGKSQNHYAKQSKISNQSNQHVNISNKCSNEVLKK